MVIGERFAWAHLPKTGGSATLELFRVFPELIVFADFDPGNDKHATFKQPRAGSCGIRREMNLRGTAVVLAAQRARWGCHRQTISKSHRRWPDSGARNSLFPDNRIACPHREYVVFSIEGGRHGHGSRITSSSRRS